MQRVDVFPVGAVERRQDVQGVNGEPVRRYSCPFIKHATESLKEELIERGYATEGGDHDLCDQGDVAFAADLQCVFEALVGIHDRVDVLVGVAVEVDAGKLELYEDDVDIVEMMNVCGRLMAEAANTAGVTLQVRPPREPISIQGDATRIRQIFLNLLSNAVKFNEPGGQVIDSTALTDAGPAVIRIRDTGIGMTDAEAQLALEPFRQLATARC